MKKFLASALMCLGLSSCVLLPGNGILERGDTATEKGIRAFERADYLAARELLQPGAHAGDTDAQYLLGLIYLYGLDGEPNAFLAQQNLNEAALNDHYAAQEVLALMYDDRFRPMYNPLEAYRWFKIITEREGRYEDQTAALYGFLRSKGLAAAANTPPPVHARSSHGINFNALFPLR